MFQVFSRLFVLIASASIVVGNGTQIIDWHSLNDASPNQDDSHMQLILYSRKWRDGTTDMSNLKKKLHTFVLIHGFNDNLKESLMLPLLTKSYLDRERCNVVVVDWAEFAKGPWFINAAKNTLVVGKELAAWLDTSGLDMKRVTLVGFSMGAHVAGDAGHFAKKRVSRIVALDPAHFLFQNSPPEFRLDSTDAEIVEVVHTSGGYVGEKEALGTRDFFPNGGTYPQPGCSPDPTGTCSHRRAYYYYSEAIAKPDDNFRGRRCSSYDHFVRHKCLEKGKPTILHLVNTNQDKLFTGNFYFMTNSKEPFIRRNAPANTSSSAANIPTPTEKRLTTVEKRRTKVYVTDSKRQSTAADKKVSTMKNELSSRKVTKMPATTDKWRGVSRDLSTSSSKRQFTLERYRSSTRRNPVTTEKRQTSTSKRQPNKNIVASERYWILSGKHRTTPERQMSTSKQRITTDKREMSSGGYRTTADKRQSSAKEYTVTTDERQTVAVELKPTTEKLQVVEDKHTTANVCETAETKNHAMDNTKAPNTTKRRLKVNLSVIDD